MRHQLVQRNHSTQRPEEFIPREQEILQLIWSGLKNQEMAGRLKVSLRPLKHIVPPIPSNC
ncbi:MAG: hypothetical protein ABI945_00280 [Nitrospirales bacterium]